jgi:purine catabolism regulator
VHPSVAEILELPPVAAGRPVVRGGRAALGAEVRWAHVSEQRDPAGTLSGGELILSIGVPVSDPTTDPAAYLAALRSAGAVALMIELGQHLSTLPEALVQAARALDFPLIELRRTVRFIEVTEAVHGRVMTEQYAQLQFAQRVADTFRGLAIDGADPEVVVTGAAGLIGLPVVLEDLAHRALGTAGGDVETTLRDWTSRSRQCPTAPPSEPAGPEGWRAAPVGRRDARWGRLVVPTRTDDPRVPMVLAQAADTVTLTALIGAVDADPAQRARTRLLADVLDRPHAAAAELRARAGALGLEPAGSFEVLAVAAPASRVSALVGPAFVGTLPDGTVAVVRPEVPGTPDVGDALAREAVVAAASARGFDELGGALAEAQHVLAAIPDRPTGEVWRAHDLGVRGLLRALRDDPRLLAFVEDQLGPILALDAARRTELLRTVRAFAEADGVVAAFATRIGTSRPAAYARVRTLSTLLGRDLRDPALKLSLQVASLALEATAIMC